MFVVARFILGVANVFCVVAASSLIGGRALVNSIWIWFTELCKELSHPKERAVLSSLFNISYALGKLKR